MTGRGCSSLAGVHRLVRGQDIACQLSPHRSSTPPSVPPAADPLMCGRVMCYNLSSGLALSCGEYNYRGQLGGGNEAAGAVTRGSEDTRP